jgi:hypothetical protein
MTKITPEDAEKRPGAMLMQDGNYYITKPNLYATIRIFFFLSFSFFFSFFFLF